MANYEQFLMQKILKVFAKYPALQNKETIKKVKIFMETRSKSILQSLNKFIIFINTREIKSNPDDYKSYNDRAKAYYALEHYELAFSDYNKAIELNPDYAEAYLGRANYYEMQENHNLALDDYAKVIELNTNNADAYFRRASFYYNQENYELALPDFSKAIELSPDLAGAYRHRGVCYDKQQNQELALIDYSKAIELGDTEVFTIGITYAKQENYELGFGIITKYIELNPDVAFAYAVRSGCYLDQKNYELALADCNKAIELSPNLTLAYQFKASCYFKQKNYDLALVNFSKAIELNPDSDDAVYSLKDDCQYWIYRNNFDLQMKQKNYDLVLADYVKAIKLRKGDFFRQLLRFEFKEIYVTYIFQAVDIFAKYKLKSDLSRADLSEYEINIIDNHILKNIDNAIKSSVSTEDKKEYCFLASDILCNVTKFDKAEEYIEQAFENSDSTELSYKDIYLKDIAKAREIEKQRQELVEKNKQLAEKNKELNNLIAMFAHNFLGTLQCIRSNAEHDNNVSIHLKTVKMMSGALTAFSIISADDDKLIEQLKQDKTGETTLLQNLANNLALAVSQLLSKTNKDKIINLYLNYLRKTAQIKPETNGEDLRFNETDWEKWQALQHQWEDEFNALFSEKVELSRLQIWLETNFFPVQIIGFNDYTIRFKEYGITDSIFLVVFMEILVNALKYTDVSKNQPLTITLHKEGECYQLICENPSAQESYRGTHKGMDFLKSIAKKVNGQFITESTEQSFKTTFIIPAELLE